MGSSCCRPESPCGSAEERSGLLTDEAKAAPPRGEAVVVGNCGPEGDDEIRKPVGEVNTKEEPKPEAAAVQVKPSPEVSEKEPNNTQENGPLQETLVQAAAPPPAQKDSKLNDISARDEAGPADGSQAEPQHCTLNPPQRDHAAAEWKVFTAADVEENPPSAQGETPVSGSAPAEAACPENHIDTNTPGEQATAAPTQNSDGEVAVGAQTNGAAVESSEQRNQAMSAPNVSQPPVVSESDTEAPSSAVTQDSQTESCAACEEPGPEVVKSHQVSESSPGSEPTGLDHRAEQGDAANCVSEPEAAALTDASERSKSDQDATPDLEPATASTKEVASSESIKQEIGEEMMLNEGDVPKVEERKRGEEEEEDEKKEVEEEKKEVEEEVEEEEAAPEAESRAEEDAEVQEETRGEEQPAEKTVDGLTASEEDLYRGAEELSPESEAGPPPALETPPLKVEDRCSLAPAMDVLSYSEREWKGNTAKSALIRKGYKEMSQKFGSVRRVRGDNYCALRATLFQVLSHSTELPLWLQDEHVSTLPKQLEAQEGLISQWTFPGECLQGDGSGDAALQLRGYMELLQSKWRAAVNCGSVEERQQLCERVFQGGEEELGLLEALKLLMLSRAVELHGCMQAGGDVPLFCWLLFARDSSDCPRSFLSNHLSHVGLSAGLEQVEMFLLGYALQCTIQVYRLYKADTEEFVTYYPDDHKDDWPSVCLVTEDDRHYNVPIADAAEHRELDSS